METNIKRIAKEENQKLIKRRQSFLKRMQEKIQEHVEEGLDLELEVMRTGKIPNAPIEMDEGEFNMFKAPYIYATGRARLDIANKLIERVLPPPSREIHIKGFMAHGFMDWTLEERARALVNRLKKVKDEKEVIEIEGKISESTDIGEDK